ncbi:MAG: YtfJ family protein [Odoribacter sp.]
MRRFCIWSLLTVASFSVDLFGQVGEKVTSVSLLNMNNQTVRLPFLGEKNLLIFYVDPGRPRQNKSFRDYFKTHPIDSPEIDSYGIINLAAASLIPNSLIRKMAMKEVKGTSGRIYFDPDEVLYNAWKLKGADNNFAVIFVNKNQVIEFYKAGELTLEEQQQVLALIKKYKKE